MAPPLELFTGLSTEFPVNVELVTERLPCPLPKTELKIKNRIAPPFASRLTLFMNVQLSTVRLPLTCVQIAPPPRESFGTILFSKMQLVTVSDSATPPPVQMAAPPKGSFLRYPF